MGSGCGVYAWSLNDLRRIGSSCQFNVMLNSHLLGGILAYLNIEHKTGGLRPPGTIPAEYDVGGSAARHKVASLTKTSQLVKDHHIMVSHTAHPLRNICKATLGQTARAGIPSMQNSEVSWKAGLLIWLCWSV